MKPLRCPEFEDRRLSDGSQFFSPQAGAPLFRQLTTAYSEENAVEDALYFLGRALGNGALDCEGYLKQVLLVQTLKVLCNQLLGK